MRLEVDSDPITRSKATFHSFADEEFAVETKQDVTEITREAKFLRNERGGERMFKGDTPTHVASIPLALWFKWVEENPDIRHDDDALREKLNDPDNRAFRTHPGRV